MKQAAEEKATIQRETMDVEETAQLLGVSIHTIYDLVRKKKIPHIRVARRIFFRLTSLEMWMQQQEQHGMIVL